MTWWQLPWEWGKIERFFRVRQMKAHSLLQLNETCFVVTCVRVFVMQVSVEGSFLKDGCLQPGFELKGHDLGFELTKGNKIQSQDEEVFRARGQQRANHSTEVVSPRCTHCDQRGAPLLSRILRKWGRVISSSGSLFSSKQSFLTN